MSSGKIRNHLIYIAIVLCTSMSAPLQAREQAADNGGSYLVQPGDILKVSVWNEPDLQLEVLVRPDGGFSIPLAGDVLAEGKTVKTLRIEIKQRLEKLIPDSDVTVTVKQLIGNKVYVIGQVNRPGEYVMSRPMDVMQALTVAGGTTRFAALNDIKILRRMESKQEAIQFKYGDVEKGTNLEQNIYLQSGDIVVVP